MEQATLDIFEDVKMQVKKCTKCKEFKTTDQFHGDKSRGDGLSYICKECTREKSLQYRMNNYEKALNVSRMYYKSHHESVNARQGKYYQQNKDHLNTLRKKRYNSNKEKELQKCKEYRQNNQECIIEYRANYKEINHELLLIKSKEYRDEHREERREKGREYYIKNREIIREKYREYCLNNRERILLSARRYRQSESGRLFQSKRESKKKLLGFKPINSPFENSNYHHLRYDANGNIDTEIGIFIPAELHRSVFHNGFTGQGMEEINKLAIDWYLSTCDSNTEELQKLGFNSVEEFVERYHPSNS